MNELKWLLIAHAGFTLMMAGVILIIQIVHYPLFNLVGGEQYVVYQLSHMNRITLVVGPLMLLEAFTGFMLLAARPEGVPAWQAVVGVALIGVVWIMTLFVNAPQHAVLTGGFDLGMYEALVSTNWIRTAAWLARGILVLWMLANALNAFGARAEIAS